MIIIVPMKIFLLITLFLARLSAIIQSGLSGRRSLGSRRHSCAIHNLVVRISRCTISNSFVFTASKCSAQKCLIHNLISCGPTLISDFTISSQTTKHNLVPSLITTCGVWQRFGKQEICARVALIFLRMCRCCLLLNHQINIFEFLHNFAILLKWSQTSCSRCCHRT